MGGRGQSLMTAMRMPVMVTNVPIIQRKFHARANGLIGRLVVGASWVEQYPAMGFLCYMVGYQRPFGSRRRQQ